MKILRLSAIALGGATIATFASPLIWSEVTPLAVASSKATKPQLVSVGLDVAKSVLARSMSLNARACALLTLLKSEEARQHTFVIFGCPIRWKVKALPQPERGL